MLKRPAGGDDGSNKKSKNESRVRSAQRPRAELGWQRKVRSFYNGEILDKRHYDILDQFFSDIMKAKNLSRSKRADATFEECYKQFYRGSVDLNIVAALEQALDDTRKLITSLLPFYVDRFESAAQSMNGMSVLQEMFAKRKLGFNRLFLAAISHPNFPIRNTGMFEKDEKSTMPDPAKKIEMTPSTKYENHTYQLPKWLYDQVLEDVDYKKKFKGSSNRCSGCEVMEGKIEDREKLTQESVVTQSTVTDINRIKQLESKLKKLNVTKPKPRSYGDKRTFQDKMATPTPVLELGDKVGVSSKIPPSNDFDTLIHDFGPQSYQYRITYSYSWKGKIANRDSLIVCGDPWADLPKCCVTILTMMYRDLRKVLKQYEKVNAKNKKMAYDSRFVQMAINLVFPFNELMLNDGITWYHGKKLQALDGGDRKDNRRARKR